MKVILTREYEKLGSAGDILNVKDGFAKNYLIPNSIAQVATKGNIKQMELVKKSLVKKEAKNIEEASKIVEIIDGMEMTFKVNASPEGKLYGSITSKDVAKRIFEDRKVEIDKKKIDLEEHIKEVGMYDVVVKLYKDVKAIIKVEVASEGFVAGAEPEPNIEVEAGAEDVMTIQEEKEIREEDKDIQGDNDTLKENEIQKDIEIEEIKEDKSLKKYKGKYKKN